MAVLGKTCSKSGSVTSDPRGCWSDGGWFWDSEEKLADDGEDSDEAGCGDALAKFSSSESVIGRCESR